MRCHLPCHLPCHLRHWWHWWHLGVAGGTCPPPWGPPVTPSIVSPQGARGNDGLPGPAGPPVSPGGVGASPALMSPPRGDSGVPQGPPEPGGTLTLLSPSGSRRPRRSPRLPRRPRLQGEETGNGHGGDRRVPMSPLTFFVTSPSQGEAGPTGARGPEGAQGPRGESGTPGSPGPAGAPVSPCVPSPLVALSPRVVP